MTDLVGSRNLIQAEEVQYKASVSEATFTRMGQSINFIIDKIYDHINFEWSGFYRVHAYSDGLGGMRYIRRDVDISSYVLTNVSGGTSGTTAVNFDVYDETGSLLGDLFSTPPSLSSAAGDRTVVGRDVDNSTDIEAGAGKVVGALNYTSLDEGWSIVPKLVTAQVDAQNLFFDLVVKEA